MNTPYGITTPEKAVHRTPTPTTITTTNLPLYCPTPGSDLWSSHPRLYLSIEAGGEATCPYCGAHYIFEDESH